ncbi:GNAT family N-acetyltransferase [Streptomyces beijiangensis]|uniref:GNAT family N-acetyltransferase n=1 Tax=Streptomyces beijiangensis TaxID=163361 RepID=A0A939FDD7_9ACTN|nr:GNAT family N-acetyltransferase [Streptomyces beijiangensis]
MDAFPVLSNEALVANRVAAISDAKLRVTQQNARVNWTLAPEPFDSPDALALRRAYYYDVASSYWKRPATEAEIDAGLKDDGVEKLAAPTGEFFVGRYDGEPAACAGVLRLDPDTSELTRVFIRPEYRGKGGSGLLINALEDTARALGTKRIVLDTRPDLVEACKLYERHGYQDFHQYKPAEDYPQVWYSKDL